MQDLRPRHASSGRTRPESRESRLRNPCRPVLGPYGHTPEQIINKLWQAHVEIAQGATVAQVLIEEWRRHRNGMRPHKPQSVLSMFGGLAR